MIVVCVMLMGCHTNSLEGPDVDSPGMVVCDPAEFAAMMAVDIRSGDWDSVLSYLPRPMRDLPSEYVRLAFRRGLGITQDWPADLAHSDKWEASTSVLPDTVVVRSVSYPSIAVTLQEEYGAWVLEPGPHFELVLRKLSDGVGWGDLPVPSVKTEWYTPNPLDALRCLRHEILSLTGVGDSLLVTMRLGNLSGESIVIPLDEIKWVCPQGNEGEVELVWGTPIVTDSEMVLEGLGTSLVWYRITLRLIDAAIVDDVLDLIILGITCEGMEPWGLRFRLRSEDLWFHD